MYGSSTIRAHRSPRASNGIKPSAFQSHGKVLKPNKALSLAFSLHGLLVILTCVGYLGASSLLILLNKFLLARDGFSFPLMLSGSGMLFTVIGSTILLEVPGVVPERQVISQDMFVRRILPLGFCSAATLALGNMAYLHLEVGLIQMLKSCCPVFVLFVALAFRLEQFSVPLITSIVLIAAGTTTTAASGVSAVSVLGLLIQFSSELCEAFRLCLAQILMCNMKLHQFEALKQMSSACVLFLSVGVWILEWQRFREQRAWERVMMHPHWYLAAASLGFMLNLLAFGVIKLTGSLTQKVLGTAKNVMLVVFSVFVMGEQVSWRQALGYQASLLGFCWYQYQKMTIATRSTGQQQPVLPTSRPPADLSPTKAGHGPLSPLASRRISKGVHSRQSSMG